MKILGNAHTQVIHGDAIEALSTLSSESVDLIFADPPYNIGKVFGGTRERWATEGEYIDWCRRWLDLCLDKLKPTGTMYLMASTQCMPYIDLYVREQAHILSRITWHYDSSGVQAKKYFGSLYEPILHCVKDAKTYTFNAEAVHVPARTGAVRKLVDYRGGSPKPYKDTKVPGNVWFFPRVRYRMAEYEEHPSQKPEALLERIILASSNPGDLVVDPFAGTFTTSAVAKRLDRRSLGIEREAAYIKVGLRRLNLAEEYEGERLRPLSKPMVRRNMRERSAVGG